MEAREQHGGRATLRDFVASGFTILPQLLSTETARVFSNEILGHLATHGKRYRTMLGGAERGGWYIGDFPSVPGLAHMMQTIMRSPRLHELLSDVHGQIVLLPRRLDSAAPAVGCAAGTGGRDLKDPANACQVLLALSVDVRRAHTFERIASRVFRVSGGNIRVR